jgi:hypothetical protein
MIKRDAHDPVLRQSRIFHKAVSNPGRGIVKVNSSQGAKKGKLHYKKLGKIHYVDKLKSVLIKKETKPLPAAIMGG